LQKKKNIPLIRFPEFKADTWQLKLLGDYFIERNENAEKQIPLYSLTIEKGIILKGKRYERSFLVSDSSNAYKVMYKNDFAFNPMNLRFGALARHKEDKKVSISKYYNIFYCNENGDSAFFEFYLTSYNLIQYYNKMATGSLVEKKRVHYLDFIQFQKYLPSLPEQTKISSFLTFVNKKLKFLNQRKFLLEKYKKELMQKLFSQELRFKDDLGKEFPKWEIKNLGDICEINKGKQVNKETLTEYGEYPCINGGISPSGYIDKFNELENTITISEGGNSCGFINFMKNKFWSGGHCYTLKFYETEVINTLFYYQLLKFNETEIMNLRVGSGLPNIQKKDILKYQVLLVNSMKEKTKIANFLTAIDDKINHLKGQIEKTEIWKKGLLQKMFC